MAIHRAVLALLCLASPLSIIVADETPFTLLVPPETHVCNVFGDGHTLAQEYALLSCAALVAGEHRLPAEADSVPGELFSTLVIDPERVLAEPLGPGTFTCEVRPFGTSRCL